MLWTAPNISKWAVHFEWARIGEGDEERIECVGIQFRSYDQTGEDPKTGSRYFVADKTEMIRPVSSVLRSFRFGREIDAERQRLYDLSRRAIRTEDVKQLARKGSRAARELTDDELEDAYARVIDESWRKPTKRRAVSLRDKNGAKRPPLEVLKEIAAIYEAAVREGKPPTKAVVDAYGGELSYPAAANRVARARKLLPMTSTRLGRPKNKKTGAARKG
jgi:hypothetical protein